MTNEEALDKFKKYIACEEFDEKECLSRNCCDCPYDYGHIRDAVDVAIEALEKVEQYEADHQKQIPMKPKPYNAKMFGKDIKNHDCPVCGMWFNMVHYPYCPKCGKAIDWSDEE